MCWSVGVSVLPLTDHYCQQGGAALKGGQDLSAPKLRGSDHVLGGDIGLGRSGNDTMILA